MMYRQKFDTFIRQYGDVGYIVNKSGFGDRVFDASGAVFIKALSRTTRQLDEIVDTIASSFIGAPKNMLRQDAIDFYKMLEEDGFIVSGETEEDIERKDSRFSYTAFKQKAIKKDFLPVILRTERTSQEFLDEHFKGAHHLTSLQIELTSRCNERCIHCYIPHENKICDIESSLFYDTLDQCREMGVLDLKLSGGEPMLHKNFIDFLGKAKECDLSVTVLSNLTLLNSDIIAEMKANRLASIQVSLYSMKKEIHEYITQLPGSFEKTKNAILELIKNDIMLQISCPVMKQNKESYVDVLAWAEKHNVPIETDYIMMARSDKTTDNLENRLSLDETDALLRDIISHDTNYQMNLLKNDIMDLEKKDTGNDMLCSVCITSLCMVANGNVYPCAGWQDYVCGNLRETPLREIWENSPKVKYLRGLRKKDFPQCLKCKDKAFCAMCMVRNANENPEGDPLKINEHFCKVAALNRNIVLNWKEKILAKK
ncbi:radical SAM protein [Treponema primitia]|uniref:radical SAM protein n=1 Tax=Treponema primitia TaxID=88058 RepID=UPI0039813CA3